jgi:radical SAM-linked protein
MELIKKVRKTGFTIAPEAGSQRLRDVINKNISEKDIFDTVEDAFRLGWNLVKLYFMAGLPTETEDDLREMVELVRRLRKLTSANGRRGKIHVSLATFIPKAHTPFQWAPQLSLEQSRARLSWVQDRLRLPGVQFKWQNPEMSLLEGVFARGDRRLGRALLCAFRSGCRFDGWSDRLRFASWMSAFEEAGIDPEFYTVRPRALDEPLPWDHIDSRVSKDFLVSEWEKALSGRPTADCRDGDCQGCEVCDFKRIEPRVHGEPAFGEKEGGRPPAAARFKKIQVSYAKTGPARFFGHLELVNIFLRALRRAGIPLKYSEGFHPKPKAAFDNPLPTGMESEEERLVITVSQDTSPQQLIDGLNARLPEGLRIIACAEDIAVPRTRCVYRVVFDRPLPDPERFSLSRIDTDRVLELQSPKGKLKKIALKDILFEVGAPAHDRLELCMSCEPGNTVRPAEILKQVFRLPDETVRNATIRKLRTVAPKG